MAISETHRCTQPSQTNQTWIGRIILKVFSVFPFQQIFISLIGWARAPIVYCRFISTGVPPPQLSQSYKQAFKVATFSFDGDNILMDQAQITAYHLSVQKDHFAIQLRCGNQPSLVASMLWMLHQQPHLHQMGLASSLTKECIYTPLKCTYKIFSKITRITTPLAFK